MLVDMATRAWSGADPWPVQADGRPRPFADAGPAAHAAATGSADATVLLGWRSARLGGGLVNEQLAALVHEGPSRRLLFAGVDLGEPDPEDQIERALDLGAAGIAVSPADQGVRPTDQRAWAALEHAARRRLVVHASNPCLTHAGSALAYADPTLMDEALRTIPALRIVFGDLGGPYTAQILAMVGKHRSAFAEVSGVVGRPGTMLRVLTEAHEMGVADKLLFGSGFPQSTPDQVIASMYRTQAAGRRELVCDLPREAVRGIVERDALTLLDLGGDVGRRRADRADRAAGVGASGQPSWPTRWRRRGLHG